MESRRLVQIDEDRRGSSTPIGDHELLIGRDPDADLVVDSAQVSRQHALLEPCEDGHTIRDLGSSNGTRVNGYPVTEPVVLTPGDMIDLGGMEFLYEEVGFWASYAPWMGMGAAVLLLIGLAVTFWPAGDDDPILAEAAVLAAEGVDAHRHGDPQQAKLKLNGAVGLLFTRGLVDNVAPKQAREAALRMLERSLDERVDLVELYRSAVEASHVRSAAPTRPLVRRGLCRLDRVSADDLDLCIRERAERVLFELWQNPRKIPEDFFQAVNEQLRLVLAKRRGWVQGSLERGRALRPMMEAELEAAKMPKILHYLSMIESGYQTKIRSSAGARGLWQFMPATARAYGLKVSSRVDERTDPKKSTKAAAHYLRDLAFEFGGDALLLAIASYNKGENGMRRALKKLDDPRTDRNYWVLVERNLIPRETRDYVPRLVAAAVMGEAGVPSVEVVAASR
jgi:hypothetical protein